MSEPVFWTLIVLGNVFNIAVWFDVQLPHIPFFSDAFAAITDGIETVFDLIASTVRKVIP